MPDVYEYHHTVAAAEIDLQGHANNVAYIQWMQEAAVAHSAAQRWDGPRYRRLGCGWVVRAHRIEYRQPAFARQPIVVRTWVANMKRVSSLRRYRIVRGDDQALLAEAETHWAFVNFSTGQPARIPAEMAASFIIVADERGVDPP